MATCLECGKSFDAIRSTKKYCSSACKQQAYLKRLTVKDDGIDVNPVVINNDQDTRGLTIIEPPYRKLNTSNNNDESFYDRLSKHFATCGDKPNVNINSCRKQDARNDNKLIVHTDFPPATDNKISKVKNSITINEDTYHWIVPDFFKRLEDEIFESGNRDYLRQHYNYYVKQVTSKWQSILHKLLIHSYQESMNEEELSLIVRAMESVIGSIEFNNLPYSYPYKNRIREMAAKWKEMIEKHQGRIALFELTDEVKQEIFRMLCEIGDLTKHIPFDIHFKDLHDQEEE